jgi:hypothetical protein
MKYPQKFEVDHVFELLQFIFILRAKNIALRDSWLTTLKNVLE